MKYQARINVEVLRLMLKYEAVHKVTEQTFTDTQTSLVPNFTRSSGLGCLSNINNWTSGSMERKSEEIVAAKSFLIRKHHFFWI